MILNNIKSRRKDSGFTIVELLVVIVVIGILAAITIVSYTGVSQKANLSKAQANGESVGKVIDLLAAESTAGYYPINAAAVTTGGTYAKLPAGLTVQAGLPTSTNPGTVFQYSWCDGASAAVATGAKLVYWDSVAGAVSTAATSLYYGTAKSTSTCTAA